MRALFKYDIEPERVAAFILEPVQGEGGFTPHLRNSWPASRLLPMPMAFCSLLMRCNWCRPYRHLVCQRAVACGPGSDYHCQVLAGGYPLAAVTGRADIMDAPAPGGLGGTYAGSPVAVAAALAVLKVFEQEQLLERARKVGERLRVGLRDMAARHPAIVDVRGPGAMVAFELGQGGDVKRPDADAAKRIVAEAAARGLILLSCGTYGNVIRILVPLTVPMAVLDEGLALLADSVAAALA